MLNQWWYATQGAIKVPAGLILAAKDGITLGSDWSVWTDADGKFLRGTDSDSVVGTSDGRYGLSATTRNGGRHYASLGRYVLDCGWSPYGYGSDARSPSNYTGDRGEHNHPMSVSYRPAYQALRLIQAQNDAPVPIGAVMFGDADNAKQAAYALSARYFYASTAVSTGGEAKSASFTSRSDAHDHLIWQTNTCNGLTTTATGYARPSSMSGGGSHGHYITSLTVSGGVAYCLLRAFDIIDQKNIKGLIGMWAQAGIPDKWELVAAVTNRFLLFNSAGAGQQGGSNAVSFSGRTNDRGHSHPYGAVWTGGPRYISRMEHYNNVNHYHNFSGSGSYLPERYHIKFIRYVG